MVILGGVRHLDTKSIHDWMFLHVRVLLEVNI
jgi:hypothetical protein